MYFHNSIRIFSEDSTVDMVGNDATVLSGYANLMMMMMMMMMMMIFLEPHIQTMLPMAMARFSSGGVMKKL